MLSRRHFLAAATASALALPLESEAGPQRGVSGRVITEAREPIVGARVTLFNLDESPARVTHTDRHGRYRYSRVGDGTHHLDVAARGYLYRHVIISVSGGRFIYDFQLQAETAVGEWRVVGNLDPAMTGSSLSGTLLPDGRVFLTSDGIHSLIFDPGSEQLSAPSPTVSPQVGHTAALLPDGRVLLIGGGPQDLDGTISPGTLVRVYDAASDTWDEWTGLLEPRSAAGIARLPDGRFLIIGGQGDDGAPLASCEILDPVAGETAAAAPLPVAAGFSPAAPLLTGEVLVTWDSPRIYNPNTDTWRAAAAFQQPDRADLESCPAGHTPPPGEAPRLGDLPDHSLAVLADGRVAAVGVRRTANVSGPAAAEIYDDRPEGWTTAGSPRTVRSMSQVLPLPDGRLLVAGGREEDPDTAEDRNTWCQVPRTDFFDPSTGAWRRVADMHAARGFHGVTVLLPDGRVLCAGGEGQPGLNVAAAGNANIEVFMPPSLSRGARPQIGPLAVTELKRGATFSLGYSTSAPLTDLVLISAGARTRWSDGGTQRVVRLRYRVQKSALRATLPKSEALLPAGLYLLFALDGDIPSDGQLVTIF